jgi:hypothetical protein
MKKLNLILFLIMINIISFGIFLLPTLLILTDKEEMKVICE